MKRLSIQIAAFGVSLLALVSANPVAAQSQYRCRLITDSATPSVRDPNCKVAIEGSLDSKYKGNRTFVPSKMTVNWSDGIQTVLKFEAIFEIESGTRSGVASVDGFLYQFTISGDGKGFAFSRLDSDLYRKVISVSVP
jgi:hypothetical protein